MINEEDTSQINFNQIMSMNVNNHFENNNIANILTAKPIIFDNHYEKDDCNFFISENMFK